MKNIFQFRRKFRVILKSGAEFRIKADSVKIKWNSETGQLTFYEFVKPAGEVPFHCSPMEIAAIIQL